MKCRCGNNEAYFIKVTYEGDEYCNQCGNVFFYGVPDVYFDSKQNTFENLTENGKPVEFSGKRDKARFMKMKGIQEVGDTHHGAPFSAIQRTQRDRQAVRREVREAIHKAREQLRRKYA